MAGRLGHAIHEGARRRGSRKDAEAQRVVLLRTLFFDRIYKMNKILVSADSGVEILSFL